MVKKFNIVIDGVAHEVEVEELSSSGVSSAPRVAPAQAAPASPVVAPALAKKASPAASGAAAVTAPLQGLISDVKVKEGQSVKTGEVIVIIEAMKMENEVVAPRDGVIDRVAVCKGESVASGDLLVSFK